MITITIILGIIALVLLIMSAFNIDEEIGGVLLVLGLVLGVAWFVCFMLISNVKFGSDTLTGYVYSKDSFGGVNNYHIRFSENAGTDAQPSFCANKTSAISKKIDTYVGTGKKVRVEVPATGWYFSNDVIHCTSDPSSVTEAQ